MKKLMICTSFIVSSILSSGVGCCTNDKYEEEEKILSQHPRTSSTRSQESTKIDKELYEKAINTIRIVGDREEGIKQLLDLAEKDVIDAQVSLASIYSQDVTEDHVKKAIHWYNAAFQKDPNDSSIAMSLGALYKSQFDLEKAREWFIKAQKNGHPFAERALKELDD